MFLYVDKLVDKFISREIFVVIQGNHCVLFMAVFDCSASLLVSCWRLFLVLSWSRIDVFCGWNFGFCLMLYYGQNHQTANNRTHTHTNTYNQCLHTAQYTRTQSHSRLHKSTMQCMLSLSCFSHNQSDAHIRSVCCVYFDTCILMRRSHVLVLASGKGKTQSKATAMSAKDEDYEEQHTTRSIPCVLEYVFVVVVVLYEACCV